MIELRLWGVDFRLSLLFPASVVLLVTLDTTGLVEWCLLASIMHEIGHFIMLMIFRCRPKQIVVSVFGIRVEQKQNSKLSFIQNMWVSLAGPIVNLFTFSLLWLLEYRNMIAFIHLTLGIFNLLTIEPLDGGQALLNILYQYIDANRAEKIVTVVSVCTLLPVAFLGFFLLIVSGYNFTLLTIALYLGLLLLFKKR